MLNLKFASLLIAFLLCILALSLGGADIGFLDIFSFISGKDISDVKYTILFEIRIPRIIMALLIGALLSSSGLVVQNIFANPIADPYIIGIASSATFGAVLAYLFKLPDVYYGVLAFIFSAILSLIVFKLSKRSSSVSTLLIIGIALSSFLTAFASFAIYLIGQDSFKIITWTMGSLSLSNWDNVKYVFVVLLLCLFYFYIKRFELNIFLSGDDEAKSLGVNIEKSKRNLLIVSSMAVAFSVAFTGMIGFVGLIIPHILRILFRTSNNIILLPASILFGAMFLLVCDIIAKSALSPIEIPIGVVTAFFGAPFFLFLAIKGQRRNF